jgi:hypothetical protein
MQMEMAGYLKIMISYRPIFPDSIGLAIIMNLENRENELLRSLPK